MSDEYRTVARRAWDRLARPPAEVIASDSLAAAELLLDPEGWIDWGSTRTALCLAGGGGVQAPLIASLGPRVTVVDLSRRQLDLDRVAADEHGLDIECVEADIADLSLLDGRRFDLVYQPISTCYLPEVAPLYRGVAALMASGATYWSEHWNAAHIQLPDDARWDGTAYRVTRPVNDRRPVVWHSPEDPDVTCWHYPHSTGRLLGEMCAAGFRIERLAEPGVPDATAAPDSSPHLTAYLPPFLRVLARRT